MLPVQFTAKRPLQVLCIGAHSDDLEIGCAATIRQLLDRKGGVALTWVVLTASGARATEARASVRSLAARARRLDVQLFGLQDGFLPAQFREAKEIFEQVKTLCAPDVIFTHTRADRHQDHHMAAELTWNTWRDALILEYEIPKYEGDLGQPNFFVPLDAKDVERKLRLLSRHFSTQRSKTWFTGDTFRGLMRLRGIECRSPGGYAEAFHAPKLTFDPR